MFDPYDPTDEFVSDGGEDIKYPTVEEVYGFHDTVIEEDDDADKGIVNEGQAEFALDYIEHGKFGQVPSDTFEKAAYLFKLVIEGHEFADGNKRTALYVTQDFLERNGYVVNVSSQLLTLAVRIAEGEDIDVSKIEEVWRDAATDS
jgi:death-on-curing protein